MAGCRSRSLPPACRRAGSRPAGPRRCSGRRVPSTAYDGMWVSGAAAATADPAPRAETAKSTTAKIPDARTIAHETRGGNCGRPSARRISQKAPHPIAAARMMKAGQSSLSVNRITASAMRIAHGQLPVTRRARSSATAAKRARTTIGRMRTSRLGGLHRPSPEEDGRRQHERLCEGDDATESTETAAGRAWLGLARSPA